MDGIAPSTQGGSTSDSRTAIVVCGSHRSGTSALAPVISLLGASLPKNLYPAGLGNETGHREPAAAIALNDDMLRSAGSDVNALWDASADWLASPLARGYINKVGQPVACEYGDVSLFMLKDPRIQLLLFIWTAGLGELGIASHVIISFRNLIEVAQDTWRPDKPRSSRMRPGTSTAAGSCGCGTSSRRRGIPGGARGPFATTPTS